MTARLRRMVERNRLGIGPEQIELLAKLPLDPVGRVDRHKLRQQASAARRSLGSGPITVAGAGDA